MVNLYHHCSGNSMNDRRKPAKRGRDAKKSLRTWKYMAGGVMLCTALMGGIAVEGSERYGISGYGVTAAAYPDGGTQYDQNYFQIMDPESGLPITMGVSGIYKSCLAGSYRITPYLDRVESLRGTITFGGTFDITSTESVSEDSARGSIFDTANSESVSAGSSKYMVLDVTYDDHTIFCGSSGETYSADEFVEIMQSFNGLGIELDINKGDLEKAVLIS